MFRNLVTIVLIGVSLFAPQDKATSIIQDSKPIQPKSELSMNEQNTGKEISNQGESVIHFPFIMDVL